MQTESFRRHADGSIDYDFYRRTAAAERRAAIADAAMACVRIMKRLLNRAPERAAAVGRTAAHAAG